jgi:cation diffusion facilitator family transporter
MGGSLETALPAMQFHNADHEKQSAARSSVIAAVGLTTFKLVVGLLTGSLGILAEAAHSGLDLAAAGMTWFAVRIAGRPADSQHLYGHGKVENLSALFETLLLLVTCAWIIYEAAHRLSVHRVEVEVNVWSFVVMVTSILVDVSRSRMLYRAAKKHRSQALEADALHFSTDIWSSAVVLLGLAAVVLSERFPALDSLKNADSVAAIVVALICLSIIYQLGVRAVDALVDAAPAGLEEAILAAVSAVPGVANCHNVRVRTSGPQVFIDVHVLVDGDMSLRRAHGLTIEVEQAIHKLTPRADITVHPEPIEHHEAESG